MRIERLPIQRHNPSEISTGRVGVVQLRWIGRVVVAWAKMEHSINDLIWVINGNSLESGRIETQNMDITKLLSALQKAVSVNLPDTSLKTLRQSITNIIEIINEKKVDRNAIVHGTWGEIDGKPIVGSLRFESTHPSYVTFEEYSPERMMDIAQTAINATKNIYAIILRLESLRGKSSPRPPTGESNRPEGQ
jgi:hypothetical protein